MNYAGDPLGRSFINGLDRQNDLGRMTVLQDQMQTLRRNEQRSSDVAQAARATLDQATDAVASLTKLVGEFQQQLEPGQELRIQTSGGGAPFFPGYVQSVGVDRVLFVGEASDGTRVMVMQHVTQMNVMLRVVMVEPGEERRSDIGFHNPGEPRAD